MTFPHKINEKQWVQALRELLSASRRQVGVFRYTQPHPNIDHMQSTWHSALNALLWRLIDTEMAGDELVSAISRQVQNGPDAGMIPNHIDWNSEVESQADVTAPPLLAYATSQVYQYTGDTNLLEKLYPRLAAWHEWFSRQRDPHGIGQVELKHQAEFVVAGGAVNVDSIRAADLDAMARIAAELGKREDAGRWQSQAQVARNALQAAPATDPMYTVTPSILSLLFGGGATEEDAAGLIEALATERESAVFPWLAHGDGRVSMIDAWLIYGGLRRYGFNAVASQVAEQAFRLVEAHGFHEFYDAVTGEGSGAAGFCASGLAVELLFREKQGRPPHPECLQDVG